MFDLTLVKTAVETNVPELEQAILPEGVETCEVDSAELLTDTVGPQIANRVYPLQLPDTPTYPAATYQLISSQIIEIEGYPILRHDGYLLSVQGQTFGSLRDTSENIRDALLNYAQAGGAGTVVISDQADKYTADLKLFEMGIALEISHLSLASQSVPAAFIYPVAHDAVPSEEYGGMDSDEGTRLSVLTVARIPTNGVSALSSLFESIQDAVVGVTATDWDPPLWLGGEIVAIHNSLVVWRENFTMPRRQSF